MTDAPAKPDPLPVLAEGIPELMRRTPRWLNWSWRWNGKKWDKPPLATRGGPGSSTDPLTWCPFEEALEAHRLGRHDGLGFVLGKDKDSGLTFSGLDIDDCVTDGALDPGAVYLASCLDSYTEKSPSLLGIKVFTLGQVEWRGQKKKDDALGIEFYDSGRYFTVTGLRLPQFPADLRQRGPELSELNAEIFPRASGGGQRREDREVALEALAALAPSRADGYDSWLVVGMALRSVAEDLLGAWDGWSKTSAKYAEGVCAAKWASFKKSGVGLGSLVHWAREDGWQGPVRPAAPAPAQHEGNGLAAGTRARDNDPHMGDGLTEEDGAGPWELRFQAGDPVRCWLRAPIWQDSPRLKDGFLLLTIKELMSWPKIRQAAADQAGVYARPDVPKKPVWDGRKGPRLLRRLIRTASNLDVQADFDRILAAAEYLLEQGRRATLLLDEHKSIEELRSMKRTSEGDLLFKPRQVAAKAKRDGVGFTWEEIRDASARYGEETWPQFGPKRIRAYKITPDGIQRLEHDLQRHSGIGATVAQQSTCCASDDLNRNGSSS